ncbi:nicotinate phosphoribosyltransferase [Pseudomonas amygdali]|uniref:Nicotinate phosphoribosyltransferase n=2 Tax=Pseudomonas amygdali pv. lachrymans TaxID=53707 RepID=A0ABR5KSV0_PSEAV|nr:nicotinate phosphoribosyltransferase [Pseudomonas amygdali]AXH60070.1 nicotinate phosphoribosyltransferase [Pseudomonas amygdali pv. lachrymans str. M301315]KPC17474.1 Nicotinate phosphoribosyltransferase [Pseudomonas amygdali pv. lachrymans]RMT06333.1 Nicotinate phosphoribosyltransferase [Pseudomonas amygdali pv. lachrymans]
MESVYAPKPQNFGEHRIIRSALDDDAYKLHMGQAMYHSGAGNADAEFKFINRTSEDLTPYLREIQEEIERLGDISFSQDSLRHLSKVPFLKSSYINHLENFRLKPRMVKVGVVDGKLEIRARGPWMEISPFEIRILSIVSEIRNRHVYPNLSIEQVNESLIRKFEWLKANASVDELAEFNVAEFGTRRRISFDAQKAVVRLLKNEFPGKFVGTSNYELAREFEVKGIGTNAHEFFQAYQQLGPRLVDSQKAAFDAWIKEYRGEAGVILTDCIGLDAFIRDFDSYFAKLFDGCRHDSGNPFVWGDRLIAHYESMRIDPRTKTLIFSDGLNFEKALEIFRHFRGRINVSFGIGTYLTNGVENVKPLNIVMKMVSCNGAPVAKISDEPIKAVCEDPGFLAYLKQVNGIQA